MKCVQTLTYRPSEPLVPTSWVADQDEQKGPLRELVITSETLSRL